MEAERYIVPKALALAAKSCGDPTWIGAVVMALVGAPAAAKLDKGQKTILAMCRAELEERDARRREWQERKAKSRAKGGR